MKVRVYKYNEDLKTTVVNPVLLIAVWATLSSLCTYEDGLGAMSIVGWIITLLYVVALYSAPKGYIKEWFKKEV